MTYVVRDVGAFVPSAGEALVADSVIASLDDLHQRGGILAGLGVDQADFLLGLLEPVALDAVPVENRLDGASEAHSASVLRSGGGCEIHRLHAAHLGDGFHRRGRADGFVTSDAASSLAGHHVEQALFGEYRHTVFVQCLNLERYVCRHPEDRRSVFVDRYGSEHLLGDVVWHQGGAGDPAGPRLDAERVYAKGLDHARLDDAVGIVFLAGQVCVLQRDDAVRFGIFRQH